MDRFIKFKKLELDRNKITLQIDKVIWGKYKDCRDKEVEICRGGGFWKFGHFYLDKDFVVYSDNNPYLKDDRFSICGDIENYDNDIVSNIFYSSERALEVFNLLNSISIKDNKFNLKKIIKQILIKQLTKFVKFLGRE